MHPIPDLGALFGALLLGIAIFAKTKQRGFKWSSILMPNASDAPSRSNSILTPSETSSSTPQPTSVSAVRSDSCSG